MRHRLLPLALVAGTLVPAIGASPARAQLCELLETCPTTTTTTTTAPTTTTTTTAPTTTSSSTSTTSSSTTETTVPAAETAGALRVSTPTDAVLSSGTPVSAGTVSATLGPVEVVDERTGLARGWVATVSSTDFTTGAGTAAETIPSENVRYWSGPATATSGIAVFSPGQATSALAVTLATARPAFSATAATGTVTATWVPTVEVQVPATAVVGEYVGTITHSVA